MARSAMQFCRISSAAMHYTLLSVTTNYRNLKPSNLSPKPPSKHSYGVSLTRLCHLERIGDIIIVTSKSARCSLYESTMLKVASATIFLNKLCITVMRDISISVEPAMIHIIGHSSSIQSIFYRCLKHNTLSISPPWETRTLIRSLHPNSNHKIASGNNLAGNIKLNKVRLNRRTIKIIFFI
ncbi:hypothetical protein IHE45_03G031100 [Dioscorea alata]|uniref:Uncharacterized protein n=1 Tax=Dioscorea alata TaxID=55571 RepID=A0ACB7WK67_DIOAL|nr:hypothetical protein IHE45_03G031100 [Dioscorea alata]